MSIASNESGIYPLEYKVLVKPDAAETVTSGGIVIPDAVSDRYHQAEMKATVVAMGDAAFQYDDGRFMAYVEPGDRVIISKYAGIRVTGDDGEQYQLVSDKDVLATLGRGHIDDE